MNFLIFHHSFWSECILLIQFFWPYSPEPHPPPAPSCHKPPQNSSPLFCNFLDNSFIIIQHVRLANKVCKQPWAHVPHHHPPLLCFLPSSYLLTRSCKGEIIYSAISNDFMLSFSVFVATLLSILIFCTFFNLPLPSTLYISQFYEWNFLSFITPFCLSISCWSSSFDLTLLSHILLLPHLSTNHHKTHLYCFVSFWIPFSS